MIPSSKDIVIRIIVVTFYHVDSVLFYSIVFYCIEGMVPALYAQDERDALCNTIRHEVRSHHVMSVRTHHVMSVRTRHVMSVPTHHVLLILQY